MAKVNSSFLNFHGKLGGLVFVNNTTHGAYVRMPRGTYKKATLNESLQKNVDKAKVVTATAQKIYKAITTLCGSFRQRDLWQMILKRMYKASSIEAGELVKSLEGLEMNEAYPYSRIVPGQTLETMLEGKTLQVAMRQQSPAIFSSSLQADSYKYRIQVLWLGENCRWIATAEELSRWIDTEELCLPFSFALPADALYYLILTEVKGGREGRAIEVMKATGIQIAATGSLE